MVQIPAVAALLLITTPVYSQYPGHGVSKSTYACTDPIAGWEWMYKYFPVGTPGDECDNNICICPATSSAAEWYIQQGRVYAKMSSSDDTEHSAARKLQGVGNGFGLHLVNVSNHLTTGGMTVQEVEAQFTTKLGSMSSFDSFMDFNVMFYTADLAAYVTLFDADSVPYYSFEFTASDGTAYNSVIVRVPGSQLLLELISESTVALKFARRPVRSTSQPGEQRASARALAMMKEHSLGSTTGGIISPLAVNRAVDAATLTKVNDFYVNGMGASLVSDESINSYTKKCYLWPGATVDVCFYQRPDSDTKGDWKVGDFADMLNTVHNNIVVGYPLCGTDKWEDNHYAIDSQQADTSAILSYVEKNSVPHICSSSRGVSLHYVFDPTGWGVQLDLGFTTGPSDCLSAFKELESKNMLQKIQGTYNPACEPGTCA